MLDWYRVWSLGMRFCWEMIIVLI